MNGENTDLQSKLSSNTTEIVTLGHQKSQLSQDLQQAKNKIEQLERENKKIPELSAQLNKTLTVYDSMQKLQELMDEKLLDISEMQEKEQGQKHAYSVLEGRLQTMVGL